MKPLQLNCLMLPVEPQLRHQNRLLLSLMMILIPPQPQQLQLVVHVPIAVQPALMDVLLVKALVLVKVVVLLVSQLALFKLKR